ncbi:MAG TPA: DNA-processing protein DprA [Steroidobacteraceae bacterium]
MQRADEVFAWMALSRAPALTVAILSAAFERLGGIAGLFESSDTARHGAGVPVAACQYLESAAAAPSTAERAWINSPRHHLISFTDPRYPGSLRELARRPIVLYVAGDPEVLNEPQLSIVGSRNPTPSGRDTAFDLAEQLAARGLAITSGLAEGIDSAAHRGALAAQGITLAVLGNGIDGIYPRSNQRLSEQIRFRGALISEFPLGTPPRRENFPQRNRIIAALSLGTLVVEAARRSGSLITARLAVDQNRELFAVPGSIHNPLSRGCHELIRQGAKLTETVADILSELNFSAFFDDRRSALRSLDSAGELEAGMDKEHKILLDALGFDPVDLDMLVVRTGLKAEAVSSMMLILELEGHVQAAPGGRYARVLRSRR